MTDFLRRYGFSGVYRNAEDGAGAASAPAPDVAAPAADVVADAAPAADPVVADAGAADVTAASVETPAAEPSKEAPKAGEPSLLETAGKTEGDDAKPEDGKTDSPKTEEAKDKGAAEAAAPKDPAKETSEKPADAVAEKPQPRTYDAFTLPEGVKLENERVSEFTGILENAELSHQDRAQKLVDMHVAEMQRVGQSLAQQQRDAWKAYQDRLKDEFRTSELGGNRAETTLGMAKSVIEQYGGTPEQVAETLAALSYTGAGNHAGLIRVLHNVGLLLSEGEPVTGSPPKPSTGKSRAQRWYGSNGASA